MKRVLSFFLILSICFVGFVSCTYAEQGLLEHKAKHDTREHNDYLEKIIFGANESSIKSDKTGKAADSLRILEYAVMICLDQFNEYYTNQYIELKRLVPNLPDSLDTIRVKAGSDHRQYTHKGWNYDYTTDKAFNDEQRSKVEQANWPERKEILLKSVNTAFDFGRLSGLFGNYNKKCDAFAAFMYYIHVLLDHSVTSAPYDINYMIPIVKTTPSAKNPDIIFELENYLKIIFDDHLNDTNFKSLISDLDFIRLKAGNLEKYSYTDNDLTIDKQYADEILDVLSRYTWVLLQKEDFFNEVFYANF